MPMVSFPSIFIGLLARQVRLAIPHRPQLDRSKKGTRRPVLLVDMSTKNLVDRIFTYSLRANCGRDATASKASGTTYESR